LSTNIYCKFDVAGIDDQACGSNYQLHDSAPFGKNRFKLNLTKRKEKQNGLKFEVYKDKSGEFRFRFVAPNKEIMFSGQGYKEKQSAKSAIESIQKNAAGAEVDDQT